MSEISEDLPKCPICLDYFTAEEEPAVTTGIIGEESKAIYTLRCGHRTHTSCLQPQLKAGLYQCPLCRQDLGVINLTTQEKKLQRYVKMLQSQHPVAVVRQRMVVDGIPPSEIDAFFTGGASQDIHINSSSTDETQSEVKVDLSKYQKMYSMGMNELAIRQKMQVDRIPTSIIEQFINESLK